jgi:hypothetical protein
MLAEIFMLRLEARPRVLHETLPSSSSQFVPFEGSGQFAFRYQRDWLVEPAPNPEKESRGTAGIHDRSR